MVCSGVPRILIRSCRHLTIIFVSDGTIGSGWTRPDEIARHYFQDDLSVFFERTITIKADIPARTKLRWILTGPHAGFTVELSSSKVRVTERFYDSSAPYTAGSWPEKITRDEGRPFTGTLRTLTVIADSHLAVRILVNGIELLNEPLLFDITRHQLMYVAPGSNTVSSKLLCCSHKQSLPPSH